MRLVSNEDKTEKVLKSYCEKCRLSRRTELENLYTPGNELGADVVVWNSSDIFGLSVNLYVCDIKKLNFASFEDDVNIIPIDRNIDKYFTSDEQLQDFKFDEIEVIKRDTLIVYMIIKEILSIKGTYPFNKGRKDEKVYNFKIELVYKPMVLNVFHFEIEVHSDETGKWEKVDRRRSKKNYIRSLATKIRARILDERKIYPLRTSIEDL